MTVSQGIAIVIVNYRTGPLVVDCLHSLAPEIAANPCCRVTVVDNASGDGSADMIASAIENAGWHGWVQLIVSPVNGGFGAGNNLALRAVLRGADADLVWLLNPDTCVRPGALAAISGFMAEQPSVGITGTMIEQADGSPWPYSFRFPSVLGEVERGMRFGPISRLLANHAVLRRMENRPQRTAWVSGCSMVVRRAVFDQVGLFDEGYFLYFEETDFCLAAERAGWACWYLPQAQIMHIAGQSTGITGSELGKRRLPRYWFESRRRYFTKNHGRSYAALADIAWIVSHLVWTMRRTLQRLPDPDPPFLLRDFLANSALRIGAHAPNAPLSPAGQTVAY